jgi:hypothetical protein
MAVPAGLELRGRKGRSRLAGSAHKQTELPARAAAKSRGSASVHALRQEKRLR